MRETNEKKRLLSDSIPLGLGMALAENLPAMNYFASLSPEARQAVIDHTHSIRSRQEMHDYVDSLPNKDVQ